MSQDDLEPPLLDPLVDEFPDACRFEDELRLVESIEELVQGILGGQEPLVRDYPSGSVHHACLTGFFMYVQANVYLGLLPHRFHYPDNGEGPLQHTNPYLLTAR